MMIGNLLIGATFYALGRLRRVSAIIGVSQLTTTSPCMRTALPC
jgi:hypothetical protein